MKSEDHIHFLSDLLHQVNELLAMIREHCDEILRDDKKEPWQIDKSDQDNVPF